MDKTSDTVPAMAGKEVNRAPEALWIELNRIERKKADEEEARKKREEQR